MPPKTKRTIKEREDGTALDDSLPTKRLRSEDTHTGTVESQNGVASPTQIEEPVELDEEEDDEVTELAPTPILGDLYLETVTSCDGVCVLIIGQSIDAGIRFRKSLFGYFDEFKCLWLSRLWQVLLR